MPLALVLCVALASSPVPPASPPSAPPPPGEPLRQAEATVPQPPPGQPLAFDWLRDGLLTAGATVLWVSSDTVFKPALAPDTCRWCDRDTASGEEWLNPLDTFGREALHARGNEARAARWSDAMAFGVVPLTTLALQTHLGARAGSLSQAGEDALMVAEAVAFTAVATQAVKFAVGRERPFVRTLTPEGAAAEGHPEDSNLSFFSGHSSFAFSAVVAAGTVAELRGREGSWMVWAVGLPLAAAVPVLRMAADKHYLSDVLVGSAVGAAMGWAVPTLLHPRLGRRAEAVQLRVSAGPGNLVVSGAF
jgi:membrane-associated phospholipid phosphatase